MLAVKSFVSLVTSHLGALITFYSSSLSHGLMLSIFGVILALIGMSAAVYFEQMSDAFYNSIL